MSRYAYEHIDIYTALLLGSYQPIQQILTIIFLQLLICNTSFISPYEGG